MGKAAKTSRKGKKAWRANISTEDIEEYFEKDTKDTLSGAKLISHLPSESLFVVDKRTDIPVKRKIEKHREKVLHYESVLQRNAFVQLVPSSLLKKSKMKKKVTKEKMEIQHTAKEEDSPASAVLDIWDDKGHVTAKAKKSVARAIEADWGTPLPMENMTADYTNGEAVEVEPPGCSFNPPFEAHQDSLAQAVADEMQKMYKKEMLPQPVPLTVHGEVLDEEDKFFLDVDGGNEDDINEDIGNASDELPAERQSKKRRLTRVDLNRRARRKEQLRAEAEAKKLKNINEEIDCLPDIFNEIAKEDEQKNRRHARRVVAKQERLKFGPPRLGKHKFEPAPLQVLLTEEISGSLRKLKDCPTLTRDRFKSFEKRGILVPNAKGSRKK